MFEQCSTIYSVPDYLPNLCFINETVEVDAKSKAVDAACAGFKENYRRERDDYDEDADNSAVIYSEADEDSDYGMVYPM